MKTLISTLPQVLVFKTDIRYDEDMPAVENILNAVPGISGWNVDKHDAENILRIESAQATALSIITAMNQGGFICIELED